MTTVEWTPRRPPPRRPLRVAGFALLALAVLGAGTTLSYYVESLWYESLGFSDVFWTTLNLQSSVLLTFGILTFAVIYGAFLLLKPARLADLAGAVTVNGRPVDLPVEPVLRLIATIVAAFIALITGLSMMSSWTTFALYWRGPTGDGAAVDPIFGRPLTFYLFTLPAWQLVADWATSMTVIVGLVAALFGVLSSGSRLITRRQANTRTWRGASIAAAAVLAALGVQVYLGRFGRLFDEHTIFAGVSYVDDHVAIPGMGIVAAALFLGAVAALVNAMAAPKVRWIVAAALPAVAAYVGVNLVGWYVSSFIVRPNELVRERPYIVNNIEATRRAFGLDQIEQVAFPAESGTAAMEPEDNADTLENIRLWDWRALQDTLRQIQEIRTYYDFPDIDIDRYTIDGSLRQVMLATRELNIERLPESSRNWINERLVYTHGYGITMNRVNGFTPEGMPALLIGNMPVQSTVPSLQLTRPEIYFGEVTNTDVYVRTRQQEFNYPEGESNSLTTYEGEGGIEVGGFARRFLLALNRGDVTRMPFSDDVTRESRLLMRRNIRERVETLAPFLVFDADPYVVVTTEGRLVWMLDAFTTSTSYPNARHYRIGNTRLNYLRNSVKATVDAYDGKVTFYVFDDTDPIVAAYRAVFPSLFVDRSAMPAVLQEHVRYPELMLETQAAVYGLYHTTSPDVFYNREDLWTVANEGSSDRREQSAQPMEPNFVLMKLPGEGGIEFVEILPFTPANRNNLIGWIAGRSDGANYGKAIVYHFPNTRLVDGPLQIEARVDQNAQLSGQLALWNQQGSHVRRGSLLVIPVGRALLYVEPIYLQAERSPMPELRIVVLAIQDRLAFGPTFEIALAALLGTGPSMLPGSSMAAPVSTPRVPLPARSPGADTGPASTDIDTLITEAARDLAEYQRLTAEGRLAEAGGRLEALKQKLEALQKR